MALILNQHYKEGWTCPYCNMFYPNKRVEIPNDDRPFFGSPFAEIFCSEGCARYFDVKNKDITFKIEHNL